MTSPHARLRAIIDFPEPPSVDPVRRRFASPTVELRADSIAAVIPALDEAERLARAGSWVVGFVAYEAAPAFDPALATHPSGALPLAWFAAFDSPIDEPAPVPAAEALDAMSLNRGEELAPTTVVSDGEYGDHIALIRDYIAAGEVYQVNLTVPFTSSSERPSIATYERMRFAQGGAYAAYLDIGTVQIMSASPELFLARVGDTLRSKPMKGTAPRALHSSADLAARNELLHSEKERAENVMIVDVVRNDLGRVATVGSVRVPALCEAERYPSVWQLTSTVDAVVAPTLALSTIFAALFPAGSITGAPKIRATEIIRAIETEPRGVYCGAIGCIRPGGDATFNVAIRTAWTVDGERTLHSNAGGGVTMDSSAPRELAEVRAKLAAFTVPRFRPTLFETIRVERGRPMRLPRHLSRIADSADYFGVPFDAERAEEVLMSALWINRELETGRARLVLEASGRVTATVAPFTDDWPPNELRPVGLARDAVDRGDVRLYHKTTERATYDAARSGQRALFDTLLWNADGQATELTRGNLVVEHDGARWTPPIECGLLAGTYRSELLERGEIAERIVTLDEVVDADALWFVNALRGWIPIRLPNRPRSAGF